MGGRKPVPTSAFRTFLLYTLTLVLLVGLANHVSNAAASSSKSTPTVEDEEAQAIVSFAVKPKVSSRQDHNLVLLKRTGWRIIDFEKQYAHGRPFPPTSDSWRQPNSKVVVLIAALRETRLKDTLVSLFLNASSWENVFVGVVQQNEPGDPDIIEEFCAEMGTPVLRGLESDFIGEPDQFPINGIAFAEGANGPCKELDHIRVMRLPADKAQGPAYARALGTKLVRHDTDEFCMQIDAHTKVVKDWDMLMKAQWGSTENEYAVLSTYPTNVHDLGQNTGHHWEMPHLCCASGSHGVMVNCQAKAVANLDRPLLAPLWAAGLSFSKCHAERDVPNDVNLKGVFAGEEFARGIRLWTHGYDFYSISRPIVGTYYGGEKGNKGWFRTASNDMEVSKNRLATLLRIPGTPKVDLGWYDLGNKRTFEQYVDFTGIDPRVPGSERGKCAVQYVPYSLPTLPAQTASPTLMTYAGIRKAFVTPPLEEPLRALSKSGGVPPRGAASSSKQRTMRGLMLTLVLPVCLVACIAFVFVLFVTTSSQRRRGRAPRVAVRNPPPIGSGPFHKKPIRSHGLGASFPV